MRRVFAGEPSPLARQAWEAAAAHIPLAEYAKSHEELRTALEAFAS